MEVENLLFGKEHPLPYGAMPSTSMMCSSSLGGRFGHSPTRSLAPAVVSLEASPEGPFHRCRRSGMATLWAIGGLVGLGE